jgi:hypothetical protein
VGYFKSHPYVGSVQPLGWLHCTHCLCYPVALGDGEILRSEIKGQARKTEEEVLERDMEVRAALDELIECWKQFVEDRRADVETDLQADKEAIREKNR